MRVATVQRGEGVPEEIGRARSLDDLVARLRSTAGLAGFDLAGATWKTASDATETTSATWTDEAATRALPPMVDPADYAQARGPKSPPEV